MGGSRLREVVEHGGSTVFKKSWGRRPQWRGLSLIRGGGGEGPVCGSL